MYTAHMDAQARELDVQAREQSTALEVANLERQLATLEEQIANAQASALENANLERDATQLQGQIDGMCAEEHGESEVQDDVDAEEPETEESDETMAKRECELAELQGQLDEERRSGVRAAKLERTDGEGTGGDCMYGVQDAVYDPYN